MVLHNVPLSIHRHAAYKKNEACSHFQQEAKRGTNKTSQALSFIPPFLYQHSCVLEGFVHFLIPPSHSGQSHNADCCWHPACQVHLCLTFTKQKQTQLESLSINVVCACLILPRSTNIQNCSVVCA